LRLALPDKGNSNEGNGSAKLLQTQPSLSVQ